ncbi:hypothetical protein F4804DRAFT_137677 [Jackrogersella minutella]|nr:hypothetical protein F4804DRAFT_137677 [Jackrogersella minutella]
MPSLYNSWIDGLRWAGSFDETAAHQNMLCSSLLNATRVANAIIMPVFSPPSAQVVRYVRSLLHERQGTILSQFPASCVVSLLLPSSLFPIAISTSIGHGKGSKRGLSPAASSPRVPSKPMTMDENGNKTPFGVTKTWTSRTCFGRLDSLVLFFSNFLFIFLLFLLD